MFRLDLASSSLVGVICNIKDSLKLLGFSYNFHDTSPCSELVQRKNFTIRGAI